MSGRELWKEVMCAQLTLQRVRADTFRRGAMGLHLDFSLCIFKQGLFLLPHVSREELNLGDLEAPGAVLYPLGSAEPKQKAPVSTSTPCASPSSPEPPPNPSPDTHTVSSPCPGPPAKTLCHSHLYPIGKVCPHFHVPREHTT